MQFWPERSGVFFALNESHTEADLRFSQAEGLRWERAPCLHIEPVTLWLNVPLTRSGDPEPHSYSSSSDLEGQHQSLLPGPWSPSH